MAAMNAPLFAAIAGPLMIYTLSFTVRVRLLRQRAEVERRQRQEAERMRTLRRMRTVEEIKRLALATPVPGSRKTVAIDWREKISRRA